MNINQHKINTMDEHVMINSLAAAAGLSALELHGFYDSVREAGFADSDAMEWLLGQQLPVEITFRVLGMPDPKTLYSVPFDDIEKLFYKMYTAKQEAEGDKQPGAIRCFMISYLVTGGKGIFFGEAGCKTSDGTYPNKNRIFNDLARDENVHPSSIGIINIRELPLRDFEQYLGVKLS